MKLKANVHYFFRLQARLYKQKTVKFIDKRYFRRRL